MAEKTIQQAIAESKYAKPAPDDPTPTVTFLSKEQIRAIKTRSK